MSCEQSLIANHWFINEKSMIIYHFLDRKDKMPRPRIERGTFRSSVWRSPNWAIEAMVKRVECVILNISDSWGTQILKQYTIYMKRTEILLDTNYLSTWIVHTNSLPKFHWRNLQKKFCIVTNPKLKLPSEKFFWDLIDLFCLKQLSYCDTFE